MNGILNFVFESVSSTCQSQLFESYILPILALVIITMSIEVVKNICINL